MPRLALGLQYSGCGFAGWQTQPHRRTVQDTLEAALASFAVEAVATVCAGRTDAGVHGLGQVVHFDSSRERSDASWVRGVNRYLPPQLAVRWARTVAPQFHARYSARVRHYDYWIVNEPVRTPLLVGRAGWVWRPLNLAAMQAAAAMLVGTHDFSSFRSAQCQAANPVRTLWHCSVSSVAAQRLRVRLSANAFLQHMVRNIVGALVAVGTGRHDPTWMGTLLAARDRTLAAPTMTAAGLYLVGVEYDAVFGLPAAPQAQVAAPLCGLC